MLLAIACLDTDAAIRVIMTVLHVSHITVQWSASGQRFKALYASVLKQNRDNY